MKAALPLALTLLLGACFDPEPAMTFGLEFRFVDQSVEQDAAQAVERDAPDESSFDWCLPPGQFNGNLSASSINKKIGDTPPHLFIEAYPDAEQDEYRVRIFTAREQDDVWWKPDAVLAERNYDGVFGQAGAQDSIVVDFKGQQYTVEVLGLPPLADCP